MDMLNLTCRGSNDGGIVTVFVMGHEIKMEFAQFARIMEYLELFHQSFSDYRATFGNCVVCMKRGPLVDGECPDCRH